jgi:hypothetical protein
MICIDLKGIAKLVLIHIGAFLGQTNGHAFSNTRTRTSYQGLLPLQQVAVWAVRHHDIEKFFDYNHGSFLC